MPHWCTQTQDVIDEFYTQTEERGGIVPIFKSDYVKITYSQDPFISSFLAPALTLFIVDIAWLVMVWASSSVGTPTEPYGRDRYIRNLLKFKMFFSNLYPIVLVVLGIAYVHVIRANNYGCGEGGEVIPGESREDTPYYGLFCTFLVLVAIELLIWPGKSALVCFNLCVHVFNVKYLSSECTFGLHVSPFDCLTSRMH